jgi:hypothetical protein
MLSNKAHVIMGMMDDSQTAVYMLISDMYRYCQLNYHEHINQSKCGV